MAIDLTFQDPTEIFSLLWRRKILVLGSVVVGLVGAVVILLRLTPLYYASAQVMIEPQKVPDAYVKTTVTSELNVRLRTLEQQIESRPSMERLIEELDLYGEARGLVPMETLVARARNDLTVEVTSGRIVEIGFSGTDPDLTARTANRVTDIFIGENLRLREKQAVSTTAFLDAELERTKSQLEDQEAKVAEYRLRHDGKLPSQRQSNLAAIGQLERELEQIRADEEDVELRILLLTRQIERSGTAESAIISEGAAVGKDARLETLELELQELKSRYTDRHPDVVRLKTEIENLRQERDREARAQSLSEEALTSDEPSASSNLELESLEREIERLEQKRNSVTREISAYQRRLEQTPRVEQELIGLTRDYNNLEGFYQSLLSKQIEARMAEELERKQQSEQFRILQQAIPPQVPYYPNRFIILAMGMFLGGGVGVSSVLLRESIDQTFSSEESLKKAFPAISFVVAIPKIDIKDDHEAEVLGQKDQRSA